MRRLALFAVGGVATVRVVFRVPVLRAIAILLLTALASLPLSAVLYPMFRTVLGSPFLLLFVLVLAYPLLFSLYLSFFDATLNQTPAFVGVQNFVRLFTDGEFLTAVRNTAYFAVFVVIGTQPVWKLMDASMTYC